MKLQRQFRSVRRHYAEAALVWWIKAVFMVAVVYPVRVRSYLIRVLGKRP